jgi:FkbM family methyltransferase
LVKRARDVIARGARQGIGRSVAVALRALPLGVRLQVLEGLRHNKRQVDFSTQPIHLDVTSLGELGRLRPCAKEPETVGWLLSHRGRGAVLYDIGANVGAYSLIAAKSDPATRVVAFEPGYSTYPRLVENVTLNGLDDRVQALQVALGDRTGLSTFEYATTDPGAADHPGIVPGPSGRVATRHSVLCYRLDDLISSFDLPEPTLFKLDVDGAEVAVLRGAPATLAAPALVSVLVEVREGSQEAREVAEILGAAGFEESGGRLHEGGMVRNTIWNRVRRVGP